MALRMIFQVAARRVLGAGRLADLGPFLPTGFAQQLRHRRFRDGDEMAALQPEIHQSREAVPAPQVQHDFQMGKLTHVEIGRDDLAREPGLPLLPHLQEIFPDDLVEPFEPGFIAVLLRRPDRIGRHGAGAALGRVRPG